MYGLWRKKKKNPSKWMGFFLPKRNQTEQNQGKSKQKYNLLFFLR